MTVPFLSATSILSVSVLYGSLSGKFACHVTPHDAWIAVKPEA